ncbi:phage tail tube protein [Clostridium sp. JN-9]|uniref:phage tail tube protein n=1 Tax=Clostridium sp. JN-9 TaxID=2507159 RepID=UPI000FFE275F|nr:phage tail tube protein [Clostridium sp. JN-9]QAT40835.1 phage portal protein [Clostridium sp. JN-9]
MSRTGNYNEEKTLYGNFGAVFINDSQAAEATGIQAKAKINKVDVPMCGTMSKKYKIVGWDGSGTLTLNKTSSRMILLVADDLRNGKETVFTIISKMSDPGNGGTERIKFIGCKVDELTLADWSAGKLGTESVPFTFEDFEILDTIDPGTV